MESKSLHPRHRISAFGYAIRGIISLIKQEPNARLHAVATFLIIAYGFYRHISKTDWMLLTLAIAAVWIAEALNTCIEMICDLVAGGAYHAKVKLIKDIAAGAVLVSALAAAIIGINIFFLS